MQHHLRQPKKYTHEILEKKQKEELNDGADSDKNPHKTKKIAKQQKLADKKIIKKKFEPSALRLQAINQTFHKIEQNTDQMLSQFRIDHNLLQDFLMYKNKAKCQCGRNIRFYCLKCMTKNEQLNFPKVKIPFNVTIIHHTSQKINKSSIIPMSLLCEQIGINLYSGHHQQQKKSKKNLDIREQQNIHKNLELPFENEEKSRENTYILFPHKNSQKLTQEMAQNMKNLVILDCTWFQTDPIIKQLEEKQFTNFVRLENYESLFWRYNHHSDKALSSAQSLAYLLREYQTSIGEDPKKFDELMFLYCLNLKIVNDSYSREVGNADAQERE